LARITDDHGGATALLRRGAKRLQLGVRLISQRGVELGYDISLRSSGSWLTIEREVACITEPGKAPRSLLERQEAHYTLPHADAPSRDHAVGVDDLALISAAFHSPEIEAIRAALSSIEVHPALDTRTGWSTTGGPSGLRASNIIRPATRVEAGGWNLVNVY